MHINKLRLFNYKNYEEEALEFSSGINCLIGPNGSGKTNLVDAIHYLCLTKSAHTTRDRDIVRYGEESFILNAEWETEATHKVNCGYQEGRSKIFKLDGKEYERLSDHIGRFPLVFMAPNDTDIIRGGSEGRRKFFDVMLCQADTQYLQLLMRYNHGLKQRNSLLKQFGATVDFDLLNPYSHQLQELGREIYEFRQSLIADFTEDFEAYYAQVAEEGEVAQITYESHGAQDMDRLFTENLSRDMALGRTTVGIHRDDYHFTMNSRSMKKFGSQGQQKSLVIALKLAQYRYLSRRKNTRPLIILDDIFDKLDRRRIEKLLGILQEEGIGQVFITDAREARTRELLTALGLEVKFFKVNQGKINEIES